LRELLHTGGTKNLARSPALVLWLLCNTQAALRYWTISQYEPHRLHTTTQPLPLLWSTRSSLRTSNVTRPGTSITMRLQGGGHVASENAKTLTLTMTVRVARASEGPAPVTLNLRNFLRAVNDIDLWAHCFLLFLEPFLAANVRRVAVDAVRLDVWQREQSDSLCTTLAGYWLITLGVASDVLGYVAFGAFVFVYRHQFSRPASGSRL
jgi:hypothetical protein